MDSGCDVAGILCSLVAYSVNVAVGFAAATLESIEAIFEGIVYSVETVADTISDATELAVYVLIVEALKQVRASECTLYCRVASGITSKNSAASKYCKPYKVNEPIVTGWPFPPSLFMSP